MQREDFVSHWEFQLSEAKRQLGYFERGMRWKSQGVDRTDVHVAALKRTIANIEKLLTGLQPAADLGSLGGSARASAISKKRRKEIAQKAAAVRWGKASPITDS